MALLRLIAIIFLSLFLLVCYRLSRQAYIVIHTSNLKDFGTSHILRKENSCVKRTTKYNNIIVYIHITLHLFIRVTYIFVNQSTHMSSLVQTTIKETHLQ